MSTTLKLAECLLAIGRKYQSLGRNRDALNIFNRLTSFRRVDPEVAKETQVCLAEVYLKRCRYKKARRHLTAALAHEPNNAHYHYLIATALAGDEQGDEQKALDHFRKSLQLEPDHPRRLSEFGYLALWLGQVEEGLGCLCRAVELAPNDPVIVHRLVDGLQQEERHEEARRVLQAARFRNPRDERFRKLWHDFQFQQLRREQTRERSRSEMESGENEGPTVLAFVRPQATNFRIGGQRKQIRQDAPSPPPPSHLCRPARRPNQRHVQ
jgi:tetratricopeptide (TPR) repeat protein